MNQFAQKAWNNYWLTKDIRRKGYMLALIKWRYQFKFHRLMKKHRGLKSKHTNYLRNSITAHASNWNDVYKTRAQNILLDALKIQLCYKIFKPKLMAMLGNIRFMQSNFRNRVIYREAKLEMLKLQWTRTLKWLINIGIEKNDLQIKQVCAKIMVIDLPVQEYVLRKLLVKVQMLANISGFKQRQQEMPDVCNVEEIETLIYRLQSQMILSLENFRDPQKSIKMENKQKAFIPDKTLNNLQLVILNQPDPKSVFIDSFTELGWLDPFPQENQLI